MDEEGSEVEKTNNAQQASNTKRQKAKKSAAPNVGSGGSATRGNRGGSAGRGSRGGRGGSRGRSKSNTSSASTATSSTTEKEPEDSCQKTTRGKKEAPKRGKQDRRAKKRSERTRDQGHKPIDSKAEDETKMKIEDEGKVEKATQEVEAEKKNEEKKEDEENEEEEDEEVEKTESEKVVEAGSGLRFSRGGFSGFSFAPMGHGRFGNLLNALQSGDEGQQMEAVLELSDFLCMATEESMGGFSVDRFVPAIVSLLHLEHNNEIMLLAARALAHLVEALPAAAASIVRADAVPILCDKLMVTEFIDLKEQIILTLEKLSWEHPSALLRAGAVAALFTFLDFFDIGVQRTAMTTIANICRQVPPDQFHLIEDVLTQLSDMLQYPDQKMAESACQSFSRLVENFVGDEKRIETIVSHGLLTRAQKLITGEGVSVTLDQNTSSQLIRMLAYISRSSSSLTVALLQEGVLSMIQSILLGPDISKRSIADRSPATPSVSRLSREQLNDTLSLINELLPNLPNDLVPTFVSLSSSSHNPFLRRSLGLRAFIPVEEKAKDKSTSARKAARRDKQEGDHMELEDKEKKSEETSMETEEQEKENDENTEEKVSNEIQGLAAIQHEKGEQEEQEKQEKAQTEAPEDANCVTEPPKPEIDPRVKIFNEHPGLLSSIGESLLAILVRLHITIVNSAVRERCLTAIMKILYFSTPEMLTDSMKTIAFSNFLAHLLSTNDNATVIRGLILAEILMEKLPDIFVKYFRREGVINEISKLASTDLKQEESESDNKLDANALSPNRHLSSSDSTKLQMKKWIVQHGKALMEKHFSKTSSAATEELNKIMSLVNQLKSSQGAEGWETALNSIALLLGELSTYELLGSGLIESLLEFLTGLDGSPAPQCYDNRLERVRIFARIFLDIGESASSSSSSGSSDPPVPPIVTMVRQLQEALDKEESFRVSIYHDTLGSASSLKLLSQPLKFKLKREGSFEDKEEEKMYEQPESLMIEPLASVADIAQFVWQFLIPQKISAAVSAAAAAQRQAMKQKRKQQYQRGTQKKEDKTKAEQKKKKSAPKTEKKVEKTEEVAQSEVDKPQQTVEDDGAKVKDAHSSGSGAVLSEDASDDQINSTEDTSQSENDDKIMMILPQGGILDDDEDDSEEDQEEMEGDPPSGFAELLSRIQMQYGLGLSLGVEEDVNEDEEVEDEMLDEDEDEDEDEGEEDKADKDEEDSTDVNKSDEKGDDKKTELKEINKDTDLMEEETASKSASDETASKQETDSPKDVTQNENQAAQPNQMKRKAPSKDTHKLDLYLGGRRLDLEQTIFQILPKNQLLGEADQLPIHQLWGQEHELTFTLTPLQPTPSDETSHTSESISTTTSTSTTSSVEETQEQESDTSILNLARPVLERYLTRAASEWLHDEGASTASLSILDLLRVLDALNRMWNSLFTTLTSRSLLEPNCRINPTEFISSKLTAKLTRQIQDPITACTRSFPRWCNKLTSDYLFLFPFETRRLFLTTSSFGVARALKNLNITIHGQPIQLPRLDHNKVAISRQHILKAAQKVMELYAKQKAVLEVGYFNEAGVGAGPTLEFYTMVAHEIQKRRYRLWLDQGTSSSSQDDEKAKDKLSNEDDQFAFHPAGLFPALMSPNSPTEQKEEIAQLFKFVGRFVGKSILDGWQLDFPLSDALLKVMVGQKLVWDDLRLLFPDYEKSLRPLLDLCREKRRIQQDSHMTFAERLEKISSLRMDGRRVEELYLDFTLPGFSEWELKSHGADIDLTIDNIDEYVSLSVKALLRDGVQVQLDAFKEGFEEVFPLERLRIFTLHELKALVCGLQDDSENWLPHVLMEHTKTDHGYHENSRAVKYLLEVLTELNAEERRKFLLWVTGSPRLPIGGWKDLVPKLTIVRKEAMDRGHAADEYLPSVMTCFNFLKLPDYSSKEVLREKLLLAINEGAEFHLS